MAGQIAELAHRTLQARLPRRSTPARPGSILLDAAPQVLPPFGAQARREDQGDAREARRRGPARRDGHRRRRARASRCRTRTARAERIEAVTKIWAAGVQASPLGQTLAEQTGAPLDRAGRISVNPDLTLPGPPRGVRGRRHDRPRPPARRRAGRDPGREVRRQGDRAAGSTGKPPQKPFKYFDKGSMATISPVPRGRDGRQAPAHRLRRLADVAGRAPRLPHRLQEPGHRAAALGGLASSAAAARERTATEQQIFARAALQRLKRRRRRPGQQPG